jgi:hypothetical protein
MIAEQEVPHPGERQGPLVHDRLSAVFMRILTAIHSRYGSGACSLLRQGGRGVGKQRGGRNGGEKGNGLFHVLLPTFCHQVISTLSAMKSITTLSSLPRIGVPDGARIPHDLKTGR